jgi:hypothetical protein
MDDIENTNLLVRDEVLRDFGPLLPERYPGAALPMR